MRILITGGAGFIGRHLIDALTVDRKDIRVLDNLRRATKPDFAGRCHFIEGDIRERRTVEEAMEGVDLVIHLAAQSNVTGAMVDPDYSFTTNVGGTYEVLRAAKAAGVGRVVFASSREVYGDAETLPVPESAPLRPRNAYGASKVAGEAYCRAFSEAGLEVNVLRLANVYGPSDRDRVIPIFIDNALAGLPLRINGGTQMIDFVAVGTVVVALQQAAFGPVLPGAVNIGSGIGTTLQELARRVLELTGTRVEVETLPVRTFETMQFVADIGLAEKLLGIHRPVGPLSELATVAPAEAK